MKIRKNLKNKTGNVPRPVVGIAIFLPLTAVRCLLVPVFRGTISEYNLTVPHSVLTFFHVDQHFLDEEAGTK